jgi:hypothetical protein
MIKTILVIYFITFIIVMGILFFDRYVPDNPKSKFGKWWRKNLIDREENL